MTKNTMPKRRRRALEPPFKSEDEARLAEILERKTLAGEESLNAEEKALFLKVLQARFEEIGELAARWEQSLRRQVSEQLKAEPDDKFLQWLKELMEGGYNARSGKG